MKTSITVTLKREIEAAYKDKLEKSSGRRLSVDFIGISFEGEYIFKIDDWEDIWYKVVNPSEVTNETIER